MDSDMTKNGWKQFGTFRVIDCAKDTLFDDTDFLLEIVEPYIYIYNDVEYILDAGDITDGASIPDELEVFAGNNFELCKFNRDEEGDYDLYEIKQRIKEDPETLKKFIEFINGRGRFVPAAFIHDGLCKHGLSGDPLCSWSDAHKIFYHAMLDNGVPKFSGFLGLGGAWAKYQAVRIGMFTKKWDY